MQMEGVRGAVEAAVAGGKLRVVERYRADVRVDQVC